MQVKRKMAFAVCGLAFLPIIDSCRGANRVATASNAILRFLTRYVAMQTASHRLEGEYNAYLSPNTKAAAWAQLERDYLAVTGSEYSCRFKLTRLVYSVVCLPNGGSGLRLSYFLDQTGVIRLSGSETAGPASPAVKLFKEDIEHWTSGLQYP